MGGVWERMIRSVRKVLAGVCRNQVTDDEGLSTLFCNVASIVNSRPLTPVSDDPNDFEPITPNHLLLLRSGYTLPADVFVKGDCYSKRRWRQIQYLADEFWRRWVREYLPLLQLRQGVGSDVSVKKGEVVLVGDKTTPRGKWPLGRIEEIKTGREGAIRSVMVREGNSLLNRPLSKVCKLEG